jgi:hypothetical protein
MQPLKVGIFDTTVNARMEKLVDLLAENGNTIEVKSIHTAAGGADDGMYHWVTVIYQMM